MGISAIGNRGQSNDVDAMMNRIAANRTRCEQYKCNVNNCLPSAWEFAATAKVATGKMLRIITIHGRCDRMALAYNQVGTTIMRRV